jgi:hypothetical protein
MPTWDPGYELHNLLIRIARRHRLATLAAGIKAAHGAMYYGDIIKEAERMDQELCERDDSKFGSDV